MMDVYENVTGTARLHKFDMPEMPRRLKAEDISEYVKEHPEITLCEARRKLEREWRDRCFELLRNFYEAYRLGILGPSTCHDVAPEGEWFECSECHEVRQLMHPNFCPNCGAKVVDK